MDESLHNCQFYMQCSNDCDLHELFYVLLWKIAVVENLPRGFLYMCVCVTLDDRIVHWNNPALVTIANPNYFSKKIKTF